MRRTLRSIAPSPSSGPERRTKLDPSVSTFTLGIEAIPSSTILRTQLSACCIASSSNSLHHSDLVRHLCVQDLCCQEFNVVLPWGAILAIWNPHGERGVLDLLSLLDILDGGDADGANAKERRRRRNAPRVKEALDTLLALAPESLAQQNADTGDLADAQAAVTEVLNEGVRFVQTKWLKP